jgi:predicted XRE-type DNA-binding protein
MRARSALMMNLSEVICEQGMTQAHVAELFGVTQPRISDLMRSKFNLFSLDTLIDMAATAGMASTAKVSKPKLPRKRTDQRITAQRFEAGACQTQQQATLTGSGSSVRPHKAPPLHAIQ